MINSNAATVDELQSVPPGEGDRHFFLNHLPTVEVGAGQSDSGLVVVAFVALRGFSPPLHRHTEEDEVMYALDGDICMDLGDGESTIASAGTTVIVPHGVPPHLSNAERHGQVPHHRRRSP
jgi:quercetin dioxygenase-like cupin family protein